MNRLEQIIGRARRNCSHAGLPLTERNVQIFLHATDMGEIESMDMYLYRLSEKKSIKIGKVTRVLKTVSVDCLLNKEQMAFYKMDQKLQMPYYIWARQGVPRKVILFGSSEALVATLYGDFKRWLDSYQP
jgi:hypothetical protein